MTKVQLIETGKEKKREENLRGIGGGKKGNEVERGYLRIGSARWSEGEEKGKREGKRRGWR